ncbi:MAG: hypothetical protein ABIK91_06050 [Pseudomonadota bacterium]|nr:hypothetical protein [Pseudomonadota bacterium]MBU3932108.1 hypothetical protein [Pseudomonadota bacterium]MBU4120482.1 hypothetical protein [Pseudomonadota bacterium]
MPTGKKWELLMSHRRGDASGSTTPAILKGIGPWDLLTKEAKAKITVLAG